TVTITATQGAFRNSRPAQLRKTSLVAQSQFVRGSSARLVETGSVRTTHRSGFSSSFGSVTVVPPYASRRSHQPHPTQLRSRGARGGQSSAVEQAMACDGGRSLSFSVAPTRCRPVPQPRRS